LSLDFTLFGTSDLLRAYSRVMRELRDRGVVRSANSPVSDIAELLASSALGLRLADKSAQGFDAMDTVGVRYQIKSRRITPDNDSTQLGVIRDLESKQFDFLLALYFDEFFELTSAYQVSHEAVRRHSLWSKAQKGHILHAKRSLLADPECVDVTARIRVAELPGPRVARGTT